MIERLLALPVTSPITPSLSQRQMGDLPVIVIDHPKVRAAVSFQGAQVLAWQPAGSEKPDYGSVKTVHLPWCGHPRRDPCLLAVVRSGAGTFPRLCPYYAVGVHRS